MIRNRESRIADRSRALGLASLAAVTAAGVLAGCSDWLEVTDPGAIEDPALENPERIELMVNGVIGDFQPAFAWTALFSGVFVDELRNHHPFFENGEFDQRRVSETNGTYQLAVYNGLHRARFLADSVAGRLEELLADSVSRDLRLARVRAYGGYAYVLLGEQMCETPLDVGPAVPSEELLNLAIDRFDEAIQVAGAAESAAPEAAAGADSIINFARIGAARASLGLAAMEEAIEYASAVAPAYESEGSPGFEFSTFHLQGASFGEHRRIGNPYWEFVTSGRWFSVSGTPFEGLDDPRVPHADTTLGAADGSQQFIPNSPSAFSSYDGTVDGAPFEETSTIRIASALEARYIIAEAEGLNSSNREFVNERRAAGGQDPLPAGSSEEEYFDALRDQRRRDFFIDGHRLGDLRRYKELYGIDAFPSGSYFGTSIEYGDQECWPIPKSEIDGNPNL